MAKKFKVPVEWAMCGWVEVEADTPEEAVAAAREKLDDFPLPTDGEYIDSSFQINSDEGQPDSELAKLLTSVFGLIEEVE